MRSTVLASTIDHLLAGRVDDALQNVLREYFALMLVHEGKGSREAWKAYKAVLPADRPPRHWADCSFPSDFP